MKMATTTRAALVILCAAACAIAATAWPTAKVADGSSSWTFCSKKNYAVSIKDVLISPDPVVAGGNARFTIPAYSEQNVTGGTVVVSVSYYGFKVHTEKDDICAKADCPIKGDFTLDNDEKLPSFTPPGSYKLTFQILDKSGGELACASVSFSIVWGSEAEQLADALSAVQRKMGKGPLNFPLAMRGGM